MLITNSHVTTHRRNVRSIDFWIWGLFTSCVLWHSHDLVWHFPLDNDTIRIGNCGSEFVPLATSFSSLSCETLWVICERACRWLTSNAARHFPPKPYNLFSGLFGHLSRSTSVCTVTNDEGSVTITNEASNEKIMGPWLGKISPSSLIISIRTNCYFILSSSLANQIWFKIYYVKLHDGQRSDERQK